MLDLALMEIQTIHKYISTVFKIAAVVGLMADITSLAKRDEEGLSTFRLTWLDVILDQNFKGIATVNVNFLSEVRFVFGKYDSACDVCYTKDGLNCEGNATAVVRRPQVYRLRLY